MHRIALVPLLCLAACGPLVRRGGGEDPQAVRLCVRNDAAGYGNVVARAELVRFDVFPGQEVCKALPRGAPSIALRASTTGGGAAGPLTYAATLQSGGYGCWRWRLGSSRASAGDLTPCPESPAEGDTLPGER